MASYKRLHSEKMEQWYMGQKRRPEWYNRYSCPYYDNAQASKIYISVLLQQ